MTLVIRTLIIILLLLGAQWRMFAQQAPIFTHHGSTHAFTNPGFAGLGEGICVNGIVRQQWAGFKDMEGNKVAPETFLITGDMPVNLLRGGASLAILQDKIGFERNVGVQLGYAYHAGFAGGTLGLGTALNFLNRTVDFSKFKPHSSGDPILAQGELSDMLFDFNFGIFYEVLEKYYAGISVTNLLESRGKALTSNSEASFVTDRTLYLVGGYQFTLPNNPEFTVQPSVSLMSNFSAWQMNLSGTLLYNNQFWGGVNYRPEESVGLLVGMKILDLKVSYSYDINIMGLGVPGSHEVSLGYCFKVRTEKYTRTYRNTRYL